MVVGYGADIFLNWGLILSKDAGVIFSTTFNTQVFLENKFF